MIARCAAIELGEFNIRVNSVHPSRVDTPMSNSATVMSLAPASATDLPPLGRLAEPEEVAALIAFLASDARLISPAFSTSLTAAGRQDSGTPRHSGTPRLSTESRRMLLKAENLALRYPTGALGSRTCRLR